MVCDSRADAGKYTAANGCMYEGEFKDDKRHGHGTFSYFSGDRYEGDWVEDKRHGQAIAAASLAQIGS